MIERLYAIAPYYFIGAGRKAGDVQLCLQAAFIHGYLLYQLTIHIQHFNPGIVGRGGMAYGYEIPGGVGIDA